MGRPLAVFIPFHEGGCWPPGEVEVIWILREKCMAVFLFGILQATMAIPESHRTS
jgi:hypothetical protein